VVPGRWSDSLPGGIALDPQGPVTGSFRVVRGGDWDGGARHCRSARRSYDPGGRNSIIGFRVLLAPGQPWRDAQADGREHRAQRKTDRTE
jgi:hypothetical protein